MLPNLFCLHFFRQQQAQQYAAMQTGQPPPPTSAPVMIPPVSGMKFREIVIFREFTVFFLLQSLTMLTKKLWKQAVQV